MLHVGINGFGTIGKRVADAVRVQPDMTVAGVAKRSPNFEATIAVDRGYDLFAAGEDGAAPFDAAGLPHLTDALLNAGFSPDEIQQIMSGNVVRVLRETLPTAD